MTTRAFPVRLPLTGAVALPGVLLGAADYLGLPHPDLPAPVAAAVFGIAIVAAAFLLSWAAEAAQVDVSAGLAIAVLAMVAVLPEYAVDLVFTFEAGQEYAAKGTCASDPGQPDPCSLALANMTGANRVLVGLGWPLVVLVAGLAVRRRRASNPSSTSSTSAGAGRVTLAPVMSAEVVFLGAATLYSLTLPLRTSLTLVDAAVFAAVFVAYVWRLAKAPVEEPDLHGVSAWVGGQRRRGRVVLGLFAFAGLVILASAEHFASNLVDTGSSLGVEEFLLVQWVAPLASEAPELIVACLYAARLRASDALGTLLSSKVNQWTLLVGSLPVVFALSAGTSAGLPLDGHQRLELLLTAAQSLFAVSLLAALGLSARAAVVLFALFAAQFTASVTLSADGNRIATLVLSGVYLVLAVAGLARRRHEALRTARDGFATPFGELAERT
ncbi:sodium:proton exchanger [Actinosynnema sp. NPDC020468]|uniref:sodium/calcium exchanger protein n=1 Tax=Actinosynnema sp. NPDC020468 TaxID=3154488 RepID=UPI00340229E5